MQQENSSLTRPSLERPSGEFTGGKADLNMAAHGWDCLHQDQGRPWPWFGRVCLQLGGGDRTRRWKEKLLGGPSGLANMFCGCGLPLGPTKVFTKVTECTELIQPHPRAESLWCIQGHRHNWVVVWRGGALVWRDDITILCSKGCTWMPCSWKWGPATLARTVLEVQTLVLTPGLLRFNRMGDL